MNKLFMIFCMAIMLCMGQHIETSNAQVSEFKDLETAWLTEYETFPVWYIQKKALDRKAGYNIARTMYPTGKRLIDSIHTDKWLIAGTGLVPAVNALAKNEVVIIAIGVDETDGNEILARTDNPILTEKGINPKFPHVFGSAKSIRGKTILCPLDTNSHQLLISWLAVFGLKQSDVIVIDIKPEDILRSFKEGLGDFAVLWKPHTTEAKKLGLKTIASAIDCHITLPTVLLANKKALMQNPKEVKEDIQNFLNIYFDAILELQAMSNLEQAVLYREFIEATSTIQITNNQALSTILKHKVYTKTDQEDLTNKESTFYESLNATIDFYATTHMFSRREVEELKNAQYIFIMHE